MKSKKQIRRYMLIVLPENMDRFQQDLLCADVAERVFQDHWAQMRIVNGTIAMGDWDTVVPRVRRNVHDA